MRVLGVLQARLMMPGEIDGLEACRRLKSDPDYGAPLVLMLSALAQARDQKAGETAGADAYITKPFSPAYLVELVQGLLATRQGH